MRVRRKPQVEQPVARPSRVFVSNWLARLPADEARIAPSEATYRKLVPEGRFELPRAQGPLRPERSASTSSTTPAAFLFNDLRSCP